MEQVVEVGEHGEVHGEEVRFVGVHDSKAVIEEGYAEVEVGKGLCGQCFEEDVYDDVWVVQVWVELVAVCSPRVNRYQSACEKKTWRDTHSFRMAMLARQSYSSLRI